MASVNSTENEVEYAPPFEEEEVTHSTFFKQFSGHTARRVGEKIRAEDGGKGPEGDRRRQQRNCVMISVHSPLFAFDATSKSKKQNAHADSNNKFWRWENQLNLNRDNLWEILAWAQGQPGVRWCKQTLFQARDHKTVHAADNRSWFCQVPWRETFLSDPLYHRLLNGRKEYTQARTPKLKLVRPLRARVKHNILCKCCRPETLNVALRFKPEQKVTHIVSAGLNLTSTYQIGLEDYCSCLQQPRDSSDRYMAAELTIRTSRSSKPIAINRVCNGSIHKLPEEASNCISIEAGGHLRGSLHGATEDTTEDQRFSGGTFRGPLRIYFGAIRSMNWAVNRAGAELVRKKRRDKKAAGGRVWGIAGPREASSREVRREMRAEIAHSLDPLNDVAEESTDADEEESYEADEYDEADEAVEADEVQERIDEEPTEDYQLHDDHEDEESEEQFDYDEKHTAEATSDQEAARSSSIESKQTGGADTSSSLPLHPTLASVGNETDGATLFAVGLSPSSEPSASVPIEGPARCWVAPASPLPPAADTSSQPASDTSYDFVRDFDSADQTDEFDLL